MVNHATSQLQKQYEFRAAKDALEIEAVKQYHDEQKRVLNKDAPKRVGFRAICERISNAHYDKTKIRIPLNHNTLRNHINGGQRQSDFNSTKAWLTRAEEDIIVDFCIQMADRGFPLSPHRIRVHVERILGARLGGGFPAAGIGKEWVTRFITRHLDRLGKYWTSSLDSKRGRAVNPVTKEEYFRILKELLEKFDIAEELIYAADETGLQTGIGQTEYVVGGKGKATQHQERSGNRENITVLPTICADGSCLAPLTIFKGKTFQVSWLQDNPLDARYSYSKKGYIDGEIGAAWLKDFHEQTKVKAKGRTRLLILDGHNSHYTLNFLTLARNYNIEVLCYPSHSTHVYQGLDVVIFGVMKRRWMEMRDQYERDKGATVSKENFLTVYSEAHFESFTRLNILSAFAKTGIVPFNPDVVTLEMMAPSIETSHSHNNILPLPLPSPTRMITSTLKKLHRKRRISDSASSEPSPTRRRLYEDLSTTSASFLVSDETIASSSSIPMLPCTTISPNPNQASNAILDQPTTTTHERDLRDMAVMANSKVSVLKEVVQSQQAQMVLQEFYVYRVRGQLEDQENKKKKPSGRLNFDGRAKVLTQDDVFDEVSRYEAQKLVEKDKAEDRADATKLYQEAMKKFNAYDEQRKERNVKITETWKRDVVLWEAERDSRAREVGRPRWNKPKRPPLEKAMKKPLKKNFVVQGASGSGTSGGDIDDDDGGDEGGQASGLDLSSSESESNDEEGDSATE